MKRFVILIPLLTCCTPKPLPSEICEGQRVRVLTPADGQVIPTQNLVTIEADVVPPLDGSQAVEARIEVIRDGKATVIAQGDIRSFSQPDRIRALWDISKAAPGPYMIRVSLTDLPPADVEVKVHPAPVVDMELVSFESSEGGARVVLQARASSPVEARLVKYLWTPGDGSETALTQAPRFEHTYSLGQTYFVWVAVHDSLGGSTLIARDLSLPSSLKIGEIALKETKDCGCERMTIAADGDSKTYCVPTVDGGVPKPVRKTLIIRGCTATGLAGAGGCPEGQVPFQCPLGEKVDALDSILWIFEVQAKLSDDTNDTCECEQGQYARGTGTQNGFPAANPLVFQAPPPAGGAPVPIPPSGAQKLPDGGLGDGGFNFKAVGAGSRYPPFGGPDWGSDDYHGPASTATTIIGAATLGQKKEFIAFVKGDPTCWCRFKMEQKWTKADGFAADNTIEILDGQNCRAGAGVDDNR